MGDKNLPNKPKILDLLSTKISTKAKYIVLVIQALVPKKGCIAISWVTDAVLGEGSEIEIIYTNKQYSKLKVGDTFFAKSNMVPCNLACATIPSNGIITADIINPNETRNHASPALRPNKGGSIKFPAPKNIENNANPATKVSLLNLI